MEDEFELERSPLCQELTVDGHTLEVEIYRGGGSGWILEVIDIHGTSTVWEDQFKTDEEALQELKRAIREEGIGALVGDPP